METPHKPVAKSPAKAADIHVLHCLNPACAALLAYEVDSNNVLYVDLAWTAKSDGDMRYFPCPKCGAKNVVEPVSTDKGPRHKVTRFVA